MWVTQAYFPQYSLIILALYSYRANCGPKSEGNERGREILTSTPIRLRYRLKGEPPGACFQTVRSQVFPLDARQNVRSLISRVFVETVT